MALFAVPELDYMILQLLEFDRGNGKYKENAIFMFQRLPTSIDYSTSGRDQVTKIGDQFYVDSYTSQPRRLQISGTHGFVALWNGTQFSTGKARLQQMQEIIEARLNQRPYDLNADITNQEKTVQSESGKQKTIYIMNWYDFINGKFFAVVPTQMNVNRNAQRSSTATYYTLSFEECGEIILASDQDYTVTALLSVYETLNKAVNVINDCMDTLLDNPLVATLGTTAEIFDIGTDLIKELQTEYTDYAYQIFKNNPLTNIYRKMDGGGITL